jgi:4-hydroxybutyryl-CoA dehydratase/vinylacetyl-CoA-Delta-isomerase
VKTRQEYVDSLRRLNLEVYMCGERVTNIVDHPIVAPSMNAVAATYELAQGDIMTATSHLSGKRINVHSYPSEHHHLVSNPGWNASWGYTDLFSALRRMTPLNTLSVVTFDIDRPMGRGH